MLTLHHQRTRTGLGKGGSVPVSTNSNFANSEALFVSTSFFFADERSPDGGPVSKPDGDSHTKFYLSLAEGKEDLPYYVTFRNGKYEKID